MKKFFCKLILAEKSVSKLALSFCFGNFIAWTPVIPLIPVQTLLIFVFSWLFRLNTSVTFATVYLINNPFTMVPIWIGDYMFGSWFFNSFLKIDISKYNPVWIGKFSEFLNRYISLKRITGSDSLCFWCLVVGGFILPLLLSLILYPIMKLVFAHIVKKFNSEKHEDCSAE